MSYHFQMNINSHSKGSDNGLEKNRAIFAKLGVFVKNLFQEYATAFHKGDIADNKIMQLHEKLGRAQSLLQRINNLAAEAVHLIGSQNELSNLTTSITTSRLVNHEKQKNSLITPQKEARDRGEKRRVEFVERQNKNNIVLIPVRGALYKTATGSTLGIAYASERKRQNYWFLGLPKEKFQEAILLCEKSGGRMLAVTLNHNFLATYGGKLGSSHVGQTHFEVERHNEKMYLKIPVEGRVDVTRYVNEYSA